MFFSAAGLNDLPPMDVSGESFQLVSRIKSSEVQKDTERTQEQALPPPPAVGSGLFGTLLDPPQ